MLSAVVIPKYVDMQVEAKNVSLNTVKASMYEAVKLTYSKSSIKGNQKLTAGSNVYIEINGSPLSIKYGTPLANYDGDQGSWDDLIDFDYEVFAATIVSGHYVIYFKEDSEPTSLHDSCMVSYKQANLITDPPEITFNLCE